MKKRLIEFLTYLGIGQNAFERKVGLSIGYINKCTENMKIDTINKITSSYPELRFDWLMNGRGEMLYDDGIVDKFISMLRESYLSDSKLAYSFRVNEDKIKNYRNGKERPTPSEAEFLIPGLESIELNRKIRFDAFANLIDRDFIDIRMLEKEFGYSRGFLNNEENITQDVIDEYFYSFPDMLYIFNKEATNNVLHSKVNHLQKECLIALKNLNDSLREISSIKQMISKLKESTVEERERLLEELYFYSQTKTEIDVIEPLKRIFPFITTMRKLKKITVDDPDRLLDLFPSLFAVSSADEKQPSLRVASKASKLLRNPKTPERLKPAKIKSVAASALTQAPDKKKSPSI